MDQPAIVLTPAQLAAVAPSAGDLLLLGSSRTGKTTALVHGAAAAAARVGAAAVLGVSSTRLSARAFQAAVAHLVPGVAPRVVTPVALAHELMQQWAPAEPGLRLLTAPEQELRIRDILAGTVTTASVDWPVEWKDALVTRSFARELRRAVSRVRLLGWEPEELRRRAQQQDDPVWVAVAQFTAEYLQVLDWEGCLDYIEVLLRAVRLLESGACEPAHRPQALFIDDLADFDPLQLRLMRAVAAPAARLVATADPDQAIWEYRGADLSVLGGFLAPRPAAPAPRVVPLTDAFDTAAALRDARAALMGSRWYPGLPADLAGRHRTPALRSTDAGAVAVLDLRDVWHQSDAIAGRLREARRAGWCWADMAVLAASAAEIGELVRGLARARIPAHVPSDDLPLAGQAAVAQLLSAARVVIGWQAGSVDSTAAASFVTGYGAATPIEVRSLTRWLRRAGSDEQQSTLGDLILRPGLLADEAPRQLRPVLAGVARLSRMLGRAARLERGGATPAEVLWVLWDGGPDSRTGWPQRLQRQALGAGAGAIAADRDLDAVMQLFRLAERAPQRWGGTKGLAAFVAEVDSQQIAAEPDLAQESHRDQVQVMSLQRAKGRIWPVVFVTGLHETAWRSGAGARSGGGGLLAVDRLTRDALLPQASRGSGDDRRVLDFALSRSSHSVALMGCGGGDSPLLHPVRQLAADLGLPVDAAPAGTDRGPHTLTALLGELRAAATEVGADAEAAGAARSALARLAGAVGDDGDRLFPGAHPARWPGVSDWTRAPSPLRPPDRALSLSASAVSGLAECPLRWFLGREARGGRPTTSAAGFGLVVHQAIALAIEAHNDGRPFPPAAELLRGWRDCDYDASWHAAAERALAEESVGRAIDWLATRTGPVGSEVPVDTVLEVSDTPGAAIDRVRVRGAVDALESTDDGAVIWDFKTRRSRPTRAEAEDNAQLRTYQLAVGVREPVAGAGLVHVCQTTGSKDRLPLVCRQSAQDLTPDGPTMALMRSALARVRGEDFTPTPSGACRTCDFQQICPAKAGR